MRIQSLPKQPFHRLDYLSSGPGGQIRHLSLPFYHLKVEGLPEALNGLVVTSDLQGRALGGELLGEAVAEELALLQQLDEIPQMTGALLCGDLYDYPDCRKLGGSGDVTSVYQAFARVMPKVVAVHGNHDWITEAQLPDKVQLLDGQCTGQWGMRIAGVGGIIGRSDRNQRKSEAEFRTLVNRCLAKKPHILLLHQGPLGTGADQLGDPWLAQRLTGRGAPLVLFGHCHWPDPLVQGEHHQWLNTDARVWVLTQC